MSLNTSHSPTGQGVLIYNGELILVYSKEVQLTFDHGNDPVFKGTKKGPLYLTSHRIIFTNKDEKDRLSSFCMPFHCIRDVKLEQPVFGANYLKGVVMAQPGGNWNGDAVFKLTFNQGGCIEFGEALIKAVNLAGRYQAYVSPPPYAPPACGMFSAPPSYYMPQGSQVYGLNVPTHAFPDAPPVGSVYMFEAPPPYTGIGPVPTYPAAGAQPYTGAPPYAGAPPYTGAPPYAGAPPYTGAGPYAGVGPVPPYASGGAAANGVHPKELEAMQSQQNQQQPSNESAKPPAYNDLFGKR